MISGMCESWGGACAWAESEVCAKSSAVLNNKWKLSSQLCTAFWKHGTSLSLFPVEDWDG